MDSLVVQTEYGALRGVSENGTRVWKGIPYAAQPVGGLRFSAARPPAPWRGVRDAAAYGPMSMQDKPGLAMSEGCLFLNVWAPQKAEGLPVVLFVHGGSFHYGAGSDPEFHGANLCRAGDVVVVTINYRLGVLGFLDFSFLGDGFFPNPGLSDVVQAVNWTHQNIAPFGGDPQNITVMGHSAGGIITSTLPVVPAVKGLISKVIVMSGAPTLLNTPERARRTAESFLEFMGIGGAEQLMALPAEQVVARQREFEKHCGQGAATFTVEVDGGLLPEFPIPAVGRGAADIPMLVGTTREEMSFLFIKPLARAMAGGIDIKGMLDAGVSEEPDGIRRQIDRAYDKFRRKKGSIMMSDLVFRIGSVWYAEEYNRHQNAWMYRFDYETAAMRLSGLHAFHSTDLYFILGNQKHGLGKMIFLLSPVKSRIRRVSREMQNDVLAFVKTGGLPWPRCAGAGTPGKAYGRKSRICPMVDDDVKRAYVGSEFRRRSFEGECNNRCD